MSIQSNVVSCAAGAILLSGLVACSSGGGGSDSAVVPTVSTASTTTSSNSSATSAGASTGTATLSWAAPTLNDDDTELDNLAGFSIHYGTSPDKLTQVVTIGSTNVTTYTITGLTTGLTYYFAIKAINVYDMSGAQSVVVSKAI